MTAVLPRRSLALLAALLALAVLGASPAAAKPKPAAAPEKPEKPYTEWKKATKGLTSTTGLFTVWRKPGAVYLELAPSDLGRDVLGIFSFARGIGDRGLLGGLPLGDKLLAFVRSGDHVLLMERNTRFVAPAGSAMDRARELSLGESVLASLKIESENDETKALLVDLTPVVVSDFVDLGDAVTRAFGNKPGRFDKDRSSVTSVKNFPKNLEIETLLTFSPTDRSTLGLESVPDERWVPISVHYSLNALPEKPMTPRLADPRVGYFLTAIKDFGRDDRESFWVRYANHWRLEKKDPTAALSEPVQPIVYYVDRTIPEAYRPWVKAGIENWQKAFEEAGFKNAIVAKDAPADSTWDAEDARYSTVRWITSSNPTFNAIGPSRVDPRSGEILDADVLIEAAAMQGYRNWWRRFAGPQAIADLVAPKPPDGHGLPLERLCEAADAATDQGALLRMDLMLNGDLPPGSPVPEEFMGPLVTRLVMHEVGHTLGLRHNFRASTSTPNDKLHDAAWTREHGLYDSVMEYITPNLALDRSKQGEYFISGVGPYDRWAIRWAYTPSGSSDLAADEAFARRIADESMQPGHEYATDDDTYPAEACDPRSNVYDLGADPLAWAAERCDYLRALWKHPNFESRILGDTGEFPVLRRAMDTALGQYALALGFGVKYVGGQYHERALRGQPGATAPLTPVPAARQREALAFLARRAFAADAFDVPVERLNRLATDRWSHWGVPSAFETGARVDYDFHDRVLAIQRALIGRLTDGALLMRLREAESRSADAFRTSELFDRMTTMLWGDVSATNRAGLAALERPGTRRDVQRAYVDRLAQFVVGRDRTAPDDARALARLQLQRIDARCARVLAAGAPLGDATRAHLMETRARIRRADEATRTAAPAGGDTAEP